MYTHIFMYECVPTLGDDVFLSVWLGGERFDLPFRDTMRKGDLPVHHDLGMYVCMYVRMYVCIMNRLP